MNVPQKEAVKEVPGKRNGRSTPTIYDIAKVAGVNASTVSRALSRPERVSAKTQKLIKEAAAELNFSMNPMARALPTGRTNTIGLIITDVTNPTFADIVRGAQRTAAGRDYTLVLAESAESAITEGVVAKRITPSVDGLILASPRIDDTGIRTLAERGPLVVINREVEEVPCVVPEVNKGLSEAVRTLAINHHRKIAFVAGPSESWMSDRRWEGVQAACEWSGLEVLRLESTKPTVQGGRQVARDVRASGVTAVLAYNDLLAIGLMQELQAAGIRIPDQISIIGFDDIFGADFTTPPLTTVRSPLEECGSAAVELLLQLLQGAGPAGLNMKRVQTELVQRGSSGRLLPPLDTLPAGLPL